MRRVRSRRAFSIVELSVSLGIFLMVGALITVAVARSLSASSAVRSDRIVEQSLTAQLTKLSKVSYPDLLAGTFTVPSPCPGVTPGSGIGGQSCVNTAAGALRIAYRHQSVSGVSATSAPACSDAAKPADLNDSLGAVGVCAQVLTVNGVAADSSNVYTTETSARVNAPVPGYRPGQGAVRVTLNATDNVNGLAVYLVKAQTPTAIVSRAVVKGRSAYLSVPTTTEADSCTSSSPCMVALAPTSTPNKAGGMTLYGAGLVGGAGQTSSSTAGTNRVVPGAAIVAGADQIVHANGSVARSGIVDVPLEASNAFASEVRQNPHVGSVCMWATFPDGTTRSTVPVCNAEQSGNLRLDTYQPYWDSDPTSSVRLAFPVGVPITLTTDHPDGACYYAPGMRAPTTSGDWVSSAACTSYTWGLPTAGEGMKVKVQPGVTSASAAVRWEPNTSAGALTAIPAAGYPDVPVPPWSNPRVRTGCGTDATCAVVPQEKLEQASCPDQYCLSGGSGRPYMVAPSGGFYIDSTTATTTRNLYFATPGARPFTLRLGSLAFSGWGMEYRVNAGAWAAWSPGASVAVPTDEASVSIRYTRPSSDTSTRTVPFSATESIGGTTRTTPLNVSLFWHTATATLDLPSVQVTQGQSTEVPFRVTGPGGNGVAASTPTVTGTPTGMTTSTTYAGAGKPGEGTVTVNAGGTTPAGTYTLTISASPAGAKTFQVTVLPAAGTLSVSGGTVRQGGTLAVTTYVLDRAGANMAGVVAGFEVMRNGETTNLVRPQVTACTTTGSGSCQVTLLASENAPQGVYELYARSGEVSTPPAQVTVLGTPAAALVETSSSVLPRGRTTNVPITVVDANGDPVAGLSITHPTSPPAGFTITTPTATTNASGAYSTNIAVAANAPLGNATITPRALGKNLPYRVVSADQSYSVASAPTTINQGMSGTLSVTVTANGSPVASKAVSFSSDTAGLDVTGTATTNAAGVASTTVNVAANVHAGTNTISVVVDGQRYTARLIVGQTPSSFAAVGTLKQVGLGQSLDIYMLDAAGDPIAARSITFDISGAGITASPVTVTTNATGVATFNIDVPSAVPAGNRTLTLTSGDVTEDVIISIAQVAGGFTAVTGNVTLTQGTSALAGGLVTDPFGRPVAGARYTLEGLEDITDVEASGVRTDTIALEDTGATSETWRTHPGTLPSNATLSSLGVDSAAGGRTLTYAHTTAPSPAVLLETRAKADFDPTKLYRVSARVRATGTNTTFGLGVLGYSASDTVIDRSGGTAPNSFYPVAASSEALGTQWRVVTGYVRGNDISTSAATAPNPLSPRGLRPGTAAVRVVVSVNASSVAAGVHVDHVEVAEVRTFNALNTPLESTYLGEVPLVLRAPGSAQVPTRQVRLVPGATTGGPGHTMNLTVN